MDKIGLKKEQRRISLYWKLRNAGVPRLLATLVARYWPVPGERQKDKAEGVQIDKGTVMVNRLPPDTALTFTIDVKISREFRVRVWLATRLAVLMARVLECRLQERTAGVWYVIPEWEPPIFEDVLLWNGLRYVVGIRGGDAQYYVAQEAAPFRATHWAWIDPAPEDEDGEGEA